jgi:uncharacterized protein
MRWTPGGRSRNLEDMRASGGSGLRRAGAPIGIGGALLLAVLSLFFGQNFFEDVPVSEGTRPPASQADRSATAADEPMVQFVSFVLDDAQDTWRRIFASNGRTYQDTKLVLFRDAIDSTCGFAQAASGPFYCPSDQKAYIDLSFYRELQEQFGAPGDFAQAYVLAHEIGHHVQNLLGVHKQVSQYRGGQRSENALSVSVELQADCFAGVWGHSTKQREILERGDVEEALRAAAAIGDDRIQRASRGYVTPETFTHGSAAQRVEWFRRGLKSGDPGVCDTFGAR